MEQGISSAQSIGIDTPESADQNPPHLMLPGNQLTRRWPLVPPLDRPGTVGLDDAARAALSAAGGAPLDLPDRRQRLTMLIAASGRAA
jgi:hypothetical protein